MPHQGGSPGRCRSRNRAWPRRSPRPRESERGAEENASSASMSVQEATAGRELGISPSTLELKLTHIWEHVDFFSERGIFPIVVFHMCSVIDSEVQI